MEVPRSSEKVAKFLRKRGISKSVTDILQASDVTGPMLMSFTRSDLHDLFPNAKEFGIRKLLWDLIDDLKKEDSKVEQNKAHSGTILEDWPIEVHYSPPRSKSVSETSLACESDESDDIFLSSQVEKAFKQEKSSMRENPPKKQASPISPSATVSVDPKSTDSDKDSSGEDEIECSQVRSLKRTKRFKASNEEEQALVSGKEQSTIKAEDFHFPLSKEVKMCVKEKKELSKKAREQLIREAYTCLQAALGSREIREEDFQMASKKICSKVPILKDKQPPSWPSKIPFSYWSTVMYQLKRRSQNVRFQEKKSTSLPANQANEASGSKETSDKGHDELLKEMQRELKRKRPNYEALKEMQRLTFAKRKKFVEDCDGRNTVETVLSTYPFLKDEQMMLAELLLYLEDAGVKTDIDQVKLNFDKIKHCFKENLDDEHVSDGEYIERMQSKFSLKQPFLHFIPEETDDIEDYVKLLPIPNSPMLAAFITEGNSQYLIVIDRKIAVTAKTEDCFFALLLLMSAYFVFNFAYDKQFSDAFMFMQSHILGLAPKRKSISFRKFENAIFK